jgi:tRNA dimethylallyltransferase
MMDAGLLEEAKALYPQRALNALQTVGYREFFDYFDAKTSLEEAVTLVKRNTRRYAKRQLTWLRKDTNLHWIKPETSGVEVIDFLKTMMNPS